MPELRHREQHDEIEIVRERPLDDDAGSLELQPGRRVRHSDAHPGFQMQFLGKHRSYLANARRINEGPGPDARVDRSGVMAEHER